MQIGHPCRSYCQNNSLTVKFFNVLSLKKFFLNVINNKNKSELRIKYFQLLSYLSYSALLEATYTINFTMHERTEKIMSLISR